MAVSKTALLILGLVALAAAWPRRGRSGDIASSFIGEATNELSSAIFQSYVDDASNLAFSPLGYSVILAILAEGARGETKTQLASALKLPNDEKVVRNMYQGIMQRLNQTNQYKLNTPEFKNWFYVYKNYTVNEDYRKILEEYYLTEVKSVERYDSSFFQIKKESIIKEEDKVEQISPMPSVEVKEPVVRDLISAKDNSKDIVNFEELQKDEVKDEQDADEKEADAQKDNIKSEDSTRSEKSPKLDDEKIITFAMEDKPEKLETELYDKQDLVKPGKNIKEKIKLANTFPKKTQEIGGDYEIMEAVEARNHKRKSKSLFGKDSNSLSTNRVGTKDGRGTNSLMILFNGLYFRGSWKTLFNKVAEDTFYKSETDKKSVLMMEAEGTFKTGSLPGLDSVAVELPYEGGRYALVVVVPRSREGLRRLVADLPGLPPSRLSAALSPRPLRVKLPSFYVEVTTKPLAALAKFGVSSIFSPEADLSGISPVSGLFVQEMVQHVSVKVDNGGSAQAQITASNPVAPLERSQPIGEEDIEDDADVEDEVEKFVVDKPFLFFVMDAIDNIVVLAGKVTDPEQQEDF